ncbi:MAG: penicillin-binding protein 2 [Rickettsiales bacterium]|nr:penicillin-binding protein 2 [Rickettsiales bacterium]
MQSQDEQQRMISRRAMLVSGVQFVAISGLIGRLYHLQFSKSDQYKTLADGNRIKVQLIAPARGELLGRTGKPMAENQVNYRLFLERENREHAVQSFEKLIELLEIPEERVKKLKPEVRSRSNRKPLMIQEYLSWDDVARIEFHIPNLPGIYIEEGQLRYYPYADKASHLIGYVGRVSEKEMDENQPLFRLPEFKIGKNGAELMLEKRLQGQAGARQLEVNVSGLSVRELAMTASKAGENVKLTIDPELQEFSATRMGEESGSIVVMDAHYGEILALVSMPAFDPNSFSLGISSKYWKELMDNEKNPLLNKAVSGIYPPGSTFKMVVALAGLKAGVIDRNKHFYCPGFFHLGSHRFNCWKQGGHGHMNVRSAIAESCDTFFYHTAFQLGIEPIVEMARQLGLGDAPDIGLLGEKDGLLPTPEWKRKTHDQPWVRGDTINASIGQGYVLATPLQLAVMGARMVNGGHAVTPTLLPVEGDAPTFEKLDIHDSHLDLIMDGMYQVSNATNGTAYWKRITEEGFEMGGKTGTSQVRRITKQGVDQSTLPWKHRHHGLFIGYAPVHNPRFVCSVVVEHGGGGSSAAAPVARDVLLKLQQLDAAHKKRYKG